MFFEEARIKGIWIITPSVFPDERGYFMESYLKESFTRHIGPLDFVQENESMSRFGVTRGLHYQEDPHAQSKYIRVVEGEIFDVAVDIRRASPTRGEAFCLTLSAENKKQLFIPKGFAHGFCVLSPRAVVQYKTDVCYHPECEGVFHVDSPALAIPWPLSAGEMILSEKDKRADPFRL
ncbi:MAG: dTDP-4-dehydrorhamnose 3,5-epimerase [Bacteroidales bacterium]|jgi:dTDP-4-dehydrorhamnose 3,5-epimerase